MEKEHIDYSDLEYGSFEPSEFQSNVIQLTRAMPHNWLGKRLGYGLRKLVLNDRNMPFDVDVFGYDLRLYPYDNKCEKRAVCLPQFFDPDERRILKEFAGSKNSFTFIDLGANVGLYSLYMNSLNLPKFKCVAIEADPYIYQRLSYNIQNNNLAIEAHNIAVSDTNGHITLNINPKNRGENSIASDQGSGESINIPCKTLLDIMDDAKIRKADAIKLDLEGAEEAVLTYFFEVGVRERFPNLILIEDAPNRWDSDIYALIESKSYALTNKTKANRVYLLKNT